MKLALLLAAWMFGATARGQCITGEYAQYKDKAAGPNGPENLAADLCIVRVGFRGALERDNAMVTRRDPAYLKNSDACIAEMRKILDAAKTAGVGEKVNRIADAKCPMKP